LGSVTFAHFTHKITIYPIVHEIRSCKLVDFKALNLLSCIPQVEPTKQISCYPKLLYSLHKQACINVEPQE